MQRLGNLFRAALLILVFYDFAKADFKTLNGDNAFVKEWVKKTGNVYKYTSQKNIWCIQYDKDCYPVSHANIMAAYSINGNANDEVITTSKLDVEQKHELELPTVSGKFKSKKYDPSKASAVIGLKKLEEQKDGRNTRDHICSAAASLLTESAASNINKMMVVCEEFKPDGLSSSEVSLQKKTVASSVGNSGDTTVNVAALSEVHQKIETDLGFEGVLETALHIATGLDKELIKKCVLEKCDLVFGEKYFNRNGQCGPQGKAWNARLKETFGDSAVTLADRPSRHREYKTQFGWEYVPLVHVYNVIEPDEKRSERVIVDSSYLQFFGEKAKRELSPIFVGTVTDLVKIAQKYGLKLKNLEGVVVEPFGAAAIENFVKENWNAGTPDGGKSEILSPLDRLILEVGG